MASATIEIINDFSEIQVALCRKLVTEYSLSNDMDLLTLVPKRGQVNLPGQDWSFAKHGLGVLFSSRSDARIIDAHKLPVSLPQALDAWRLVQFFEAIGVESVEEKGVIFAVGSESDVKQLLLILEENGVLFGVDGQPNMYALA